MNGPAARPGCGPAARLAAARLRGWLRPGCAAGCGPAARLAAARLRGWLRPGCTAAARLAAARLRDPAARPGCATRLRDRLGGWLPPGWAAEDRGPVPVVAAG
jgi:hypothetical protein